VSRGTLVTGLVAAAPLLLFASYLVYLRSIAARRRESRSGAPPDTSSNSARLIPLWAVLAALGVLAVVVLFLVDAHIARGLLVAIVPFVIFFGFWMFLRWRVRRPPAILAEDAPEDPRERPPGRPVVTARSRRMALLPIALVLGVSAIIRALIGH
jgi:hypothetical protein